MNIILINNAHALFEFEFFKCDDYKNKKVSHLFYYTKTYVKRKIIFILKKIIDFFWRQQTVYK